MKDHPRIATPALTDPPQSGPHVVVIGGGASGVLMAVHLLSRHYPAYRVTLVESRHEPGRGLAYSTDDPDHLLNTRVHNMSAFPDDPGHFLKWLQNEPDHRDVTGQCSVSRATYGRYLADLLEPWQSGAEPHRLRIVRQTAIRLQDTSRGVVAHLQDGQSVIGDIGVLATGHALQMPGPTNPLLGSQNDPGLIDPQARIIIGSGLSMVDSVITLLKIGHKGEILSVSRRGLLPRAHLPTTPLNLSLGDVPFGAPMSVLIDWVRSLCRRAEQRGGTWRDAVDGIRPHVRAIWRSLPPVERARFLRHAATWWDVHRHRIPPTSDATIRNALSEGQLRLVQGRFIDATDQPGGGAELRFQPKGTASVVAISAAAIIDCRGIRRDPERNATPLIADLLLRGRARVDAHRIGLDVDANCRLIDHAGLPSDRLLAIGPVSRTAFWEITAIPDIREQTAKLADALSQ